VLENAVSVGVADGVLKRWYEAFSYPQSLFTF
jgi:hypothetical protein